MLEVKSHSFVIDRIKPVTKGVLHYFIEQPYMEHLWTVIACNILSHYISGDPLDSRFYETNDIYTDKNVINDIKVQCNVFPSVDKEHGIIDATHEFEFYKGNAKIQEALFYTVYLQTDFTEDIRNFIIRNLMQGIITGEKKKTVLLAIVTPDMEWHIGIITFEEILRIFKFAATGLGIQVNVYHNREDALALLPDRSSTGFL